MKIGGRWPMLSSGYSIELLTIASFELTSSIQVIGL